MRDVAAAAARNAALARARVSVADPTASTAAPTAPPTAPEMMLIRARRELAETRSAGLSTRPGTSAWRVTPEALAKMSRARAKK